MNIKEGISLIVVVILLVLIDIVRRLEISLGFQILIFWLGMVCVILLMKLLYQELHHTSADIYIKYVRLQYWLWAGGILFVSLLLVIFPLTFLPPYFPYIFGLFGLAVGYLLFQTRS